MRRRADTGDRPPVMAARLFRWLLPADFREEVLGDLHEEYRARVQGGSRARARRWYWRQLLSRDILRLRRESRRDATRSSRRAAWSRVVSAAGMDVRYAARGLRRRPGFTAVVVAMLAFGIGANTAIFTVVYGILVEPLPYAEPDRLVLLWNRLERAGSGKAPIAGMDVIDFRRDATSFIDVAATDRTTNAVLSAGGEAMSIRMGRATDNLFPLLGVPLELGRPFREAPRPLDGSGDAAVATVEEIVVSHGLWQRVFGGDSGIVGRTVQVNGGPRLVVGVLAPGFRLLLPRDVGMPTTVDAWSPLRLEGDRGVREGQRIRDQDSDDTGAVIARLRDGVTVPQARSEMQAVAARLRDRHRYYADAGLVIDVYAMHDDIVAGVRPFVVVLFGAVGFVLLIACVNVANLMLVRAAGRRGEMAVRVALGASRGRLVGQLFIEALVLALAGGVLGLGVAAVALEGLLALGPSTIPRLDEMGISGSALGFTAGITVAVAVLFGLVPAVEASFWPPGSLLRARGTSRHPVVRSSLVVIEVGLSMALLIGAGLLLRTLVQLHRVEPGFDPTGVVAFDLTLRDRERYGGPAARSRFIGQLEDRLRALPGVEAVGLVGGLPLAGTRWTQQYGLEGQSEERWGANEANFRMITAEYFAAMRIDVLAGRPFDANDDRQDVRVAIVDRSLASRIAPGTDAVGRRVGFPLDGERVWARIIGVVESVRHDDLRVPGRETIYVPYRHEASRDISMVVRSASDPAMLGPALRRAARDLDPNVPLYNLRSLDSYVSDALGPTRFTLVLVAAFAMLALVLATVGLYGVLAYAVSRRTPEIGLRIALGAGPQRMTRDVVWSGLRVTGFGVVGGAALASLLSRTISGILYGVPPVDPISFAFAAVILGLVAGIACLLPARRAARIDPVTALRAE